MFDPEYMEINGRKGRRVICVLSRNRQQYKILDLSGDEDGDDSEKSEGEESEQAGKESDEVG